MVSESDWEAMCDGCGKCCAIRTTEYACPAFNCKTRRCTSYADRTERYVCAKVTPDNIAPLYEAGILPDSCAYVRWAQKKPPLDEVEGAAFKPFHSAPLSLRRTIQKQIVAVRKKAKSSPSS
jgi:uncharacterized cysteine cluster protein YcgN (CxxCxxCC family)